MSAPPQPPSGHPPAAPAPRPSADDPNGLIGTVFGQRYRVTGLVGQGGMSVVYKALHTRLDKVVALKVLSPGIVQDDKHVLRFTQEAKACSRLSHPNIIRVFDYGQASNGLLFITMELLEGEPVADYLDRMGPLAPAEACGIMRQACLALQEAHQQGIIHRDLKPDNMFLTRADGHQGPVKILDFGIAKVTGETNYETLTQTGYICGTPLYISPEQSLGMQLDGRTDLYSVGVILFELLAGQTPFVADSPIALVMKHIHNDPPKLAHVNPNIQVSPELEALVYSLLAKDRDKRPISAKAVADQLEALARTAAVSAPAAAPAGSVTQQELTQLAEDDEALIVHAHPASEVEATRLDAEAVSSHDLETRVVPHLDEAALLGAGAFKTQTVGDAKATQALTQGQRHHMARLTRKGASSGARVRRSSPAHAPVRPIGHVPTGRTGPGAWVWLALVASLIAIGLTTIVLLKPQWLAPISSGDAGDRADAAAPAVEPVAASEAARPDSAALHSAAAGVDSALPTAVATVQKPSAAPSSVVERPSAPAPAVDAGTSPSIARPAVAVVRRPRQALVVRIEAAAPAKEEAPAPRMVKIDSVPAGATVVHRGRKLGKTPFSFEATANTQTTTLIVTAAGYWPETWTFEPGPAPPPGQDKVTLVLRSKPGTTATTAGANRAAGNTAATSATAAKPKVRPKKRKKKKKKIVWEE